MSYHADKLVIDGHTDTHAGNDNIRRPKLASGKNGKWNHNIITIQSSVKQ